MSLRAKFGICAGVVALWHCPQRFWLRTLFQKLTSNACTSAVAGAGPVYALAVLTGADPGLALVGAPLFVVLLRQRAR